MAKPRAQTGLRAVSLKAWGRGLKWTLYEASLGVGGGRGRSPEPKGGQSWQPRPQALPTRLQQQICLVMLRRMGSEQPPSRSTRKQGPLASEITCWAGGGGGTFRRGFGKAGDL